MTTTINEFLAGTRENYGFLLKAKDGEVDIVSFETSETSNQEQRPKLVLTVESTGIENVFVNSKTGSLFSVQKQGQSLVIGMPSAGYRTVELIGVNGRKIVTSNGNEKLLKLNVSSVPTGIYIVNVHADGLNVHQERIVISR